MLTCSVDRKKKKIGCVVTLLDCALYLHLCCLWLLLCVTGLDEHPVETPVTVEGGFSVWFKTRQYHYFTLMSQVTDRCRKLDQYLEQPTQFDDDGKLPKRRDDDGQAAEAA